MYNEYFGLTDRPFSIAPDPRYLYMSSQHKEALAHLMYGVQQDGGFILLTGEVGTGKTTVCRCFLKQLDEKIDVAYIVNPKQTSLELLESMCDDLAIARYQDEITVKSLTDAITERLLNNHAEGKNTVLLIDEAQNLSVDVLEQLRLLTNLETDQKKLLQIILLGQPELLDLLNKPELRQLSQRVTARFHMDRLDRKDIIPYVRHRLAVAGCKMVLFPEQTAKAIEKASGGVPRLINLICDRALLGVYSSNGNTVTVATLKKAAKEVLGEQRDSLYQSSVTFIRCNPIFSALSVLSVFVIVFFAGFMLNSHPAQAPTVVESVDIDTQPTTINHSQVKSEVASNVLDGLMNAKAYELLGRPWGIDQLPNDWQHLCDELSETRLSCSSENMSFSRLLKLNRPIVASVIYQGKTEHLLVVGVKGAIDNLNLELLDNQGISKEISASTFKAIWTGKSEYLWLEPEKDLPFLKPGDTHHYIERVRADLLGDLFDKSEQSTLYDQELLERVKAFQRDSGITSDGVIGPETIMLLNQMFEDVPVLVSAKKLKRKKEKI